jgi:hypothetical protein
MDIKRPSHKADEPSCNVVNKQMRPMLTRLCASHDMQHQHALLYCVADC